VYLLAVRIDFQEDDLQLSDNFPFRHSLERDCVTILLCHCERPKGAWQSLYPPSQKTTGLPVDECANALCATARCRPEAEADNRGVAEGEDG
jgi:hypothetical protein